VTISYTVKKGSTAMVALVFARDPATGAPVEGLSASSAGARCAVARAGAGSATPVTLHAGQVGRYEPGGWSEVDPALVPGVYEFGVPDEAVADGAEEALVVFGFDGAIVGPLHLSLVAYDPQDAERLGMYAIGPEGRIAALRGAFPLVAQREMDELLARKEPG
jgi:hypothetical protein